MDLGEILGRLTTFDLVVILFFIGFFILGFAQGTIRRVLGIASVLFSFLFAANLREPLGRFLAENWRQFPTEYSYMIGFLGVFIAATIAFTVTIQTFYKTQPLFANARFADELLGGLLGILQAFLFIAITLVILDSFYRVPGVPQSQGEVIFVRDFWNALNESATAEFFRQSVLPVFFTIVGLFIPNSIKFLFPDSAS